MTQTMQSITFEYKLTNNKEQNYENPRRTNGHNQA